MTCAIAHIQLAGPVTGTVIIDLRDWAWATRWKWRGKHDKHKRKIYAYRIGKTWTDKRTSLYLHVELHRRLKKRPSRRHVLVDHRNGNSLDCRRVNLRWATRSQNRLNINGVRLRRKRKAKREH